MKPWLWLLAILMVCAGAAPASAQQENQSAETAKSEKPALLHAYRVDFSINEMEDGKKINSRRYSVNLNAGDWQKLKIGTRVPVATGSFSGTGKETNPLVNTQFQYIDVGTNIDCHLDQRGDDFVGLQVRSDFSNFSTPEEQHPSQPILKQPIIRQIAINGSTLVQPGKTVVIGTVDDPNSNREFQLEATVTRLR
jgi:type II/III secretion system protein